jgi:hypothetical protein
MTEASPEKECGAPRMDTHQIRTKSPFTGFSTPNSDSSVTFGTFESIVARRIFPARQPEVCPL